MNLSSPSVVSLLEMHVESFHKNKYLQSTYNELSLGSGIKMSEIKFLSKIILYFRGIDTQKKLILVAQ